MDEIANLVEDDGSTTKHGGSLSIKFAKLSAAQNNLFLPDILKDDLVRLLPPFRRQLPRPCDVGDHKVGV
jgi:hypothetical protein